MFNNFFENRAIYEVV